MGFLLTINLILFQGYLTVAFLFINRYSLLQLFETIKNDYWSIERIGDTKYREKCEADLERLKMKYRIYITFLMTDVTVYLYENSVRNRKVTPETFRIPLYIPPWAPDISVILMHTFDTWSMMLSMAITDTLTFTLATLMDMQYRILNYELLTIFNDKNEKNRWGKLRSCIDHMTFLTEWVWQFGSLSCRVKPAKVPTVRNQ